MASSLRKIPVKDDDANASGGKYVFWKTAATRSLSPFPQKKQECIPLKVAYSAPYGNKIQNLYVNGVDQGQCSFSPTKEGEWKELDLGSVKLDAGDNTISIVGSWGWTNFDYITVKRQHSRTSPPAIPSAATRQQPHRQTA